MSPDVGAWAFIDTNILAYAHDTTEAERHEVARAVVRDLWRTRSGALSTQVLQEFYVVVTRKFDPPLGRGEARDLVDAYSRWKLVSVDVPLILAASQLEERYSLSFWDALIVEAARRAGATRLLTEDMQDGARLAGVRIENPFVAQDPG